MVDLLFDDVACSVFVIGNDLRPIWSSAPDGRLFGKELTAWKPGSLIDVVHLDDREALETQRHELLSTPGATVRGTMRLCPPDLQPSTVDFAATNRFDDPSINGLVVTTRPVAKEPTSTPNTPPTVFSLSELIDDIVATYTPIGIDLRGSVDAEVPTAVRGDAERLSAVLRQLVSTGFCSAASGPNRLEVGVADAQRTSFSLTLVGTVDTGHDAANDTIGLALARHDIEVMGGELRHDSSGAASTFRFDIGLPPARRIEDRIVPGGHAPRSSPVEPHVPLHVLVVDDSTVNRLLATSQLDRLGHTFDTAAGGAEALEMLTTRDFDVVLMDWHMPGVDGLEATRRWRADHDPQHALPIVTMTASAMAGDRERCLDAGATDYLAKPVSIDDLRTLLARWTPADDESDTPVASPQTPQRPKVKDLIEDLGDVTVVQSIVDAFINLVPLHRAAAASAAKTEDRPVVRRSAHTLKSSALMLGIDDLAEACIHLETAIDDACDDIDIEVESFVRACRRAVPELETIAAGLSQTPGSNQ